MRIKDMNLSQLNNVLNELYKLQGAKDIFKKFNIELINKDTELQGITDLINSISNLFKDNKEAKEFLQVFNFMNQEIETKKKMVEAAEGMMKQLLNMQIVSSEQSLDMIEKQTKEAVLPEILKLAKENIVNEEDLIEVEKIIKANKLNHLNIDSIYCEIVSKIENRYSETEKEVKEEPKVEIKENTSKEETKTEKTKVQSTLDEIEKEDFTKELDDDIKSESKEEITKEESQNNMGLDFGDFSEEIKEDKKESKEEYKENSSDIDFFNDDDFKEFGSDNNNDDLGFGFSLNNDDAF